MSDRTLHWIMGVLTLAALAVFGVIAMPPTAAAQTVPALAQQYAPILVTRQREIWPDATMPHYIAGQVEQETCISLRHSKCWNPRAELKTSRENGIGLGQFTRAYRADGSIRFDKISELAAAHQSLRGWSWETRYDVSYQLTAIVEMDRATWRRVRDTATDDDHWRMTLAAYNGGEGGLAQDRRLCANTSGCDPSRWLGHVEGTCTKSKIPQPGYKLSFCAINREYPHNVIDLRAPKYELFFTGGTSD